MEFKITTMTPVHVGTGENNPSFLYHQDTFGNINCYHFNDLLKQVPPKKLINLEIINPSNNGKRAINNLFDHYVDYQKIPVKYSLISYEYRFNNDVSEQIKSANQPYIPGSSIKGAIMNCILYALLKEKKKDKNIKAILQQIKNTSKERFEKRLFESLFDENFNDIFTLYSSCIICHDISFNQMILCNGLRLNMNGTNGKTRDQGFQKLECINSNLTTIDSLIEIDQNRKKVLLNQYSDKLQNKYADLKKFLNINNIMIACRNYYRYLIKEEKEYFINDKLHIFENNDFEGRYDIIDFLNQFTIDDKNAFYLRIGNSTNYFYKSLSIFIKQYYYDFYVKNFSLFAPVRLDRKPHPTADTMPKTRTVITTNNYTYLAGFIKFERIN